MMVGRWNFLLKWSLLGGHVSFWNGKLTWQAGISPCSIGNTSSNAAFSSAMFVYQSVTIPPNTRIHVQAKSLMAWLCSNFLPTEKYLPIWSLVSNSQNFWTGIHIHQMKKEAINDSKTRLTNLICKKEYSPFHAASWNFAVTKTCDPWDDFVYLRSTSIIRINH